MIKISAKTLNDRLNLKYSVFSVNCGDVMPPLGDPSIYLEAEEVQPVAQKSHDKDITRSMVSHSQQLSWSPHGGTATASHRSMDPIDQPNEAQRRKKGGRSIAQVDGLLQNALIT